LPSRLKYKSFSWNFSGGPTPDLAVIPDVFVTGAPPKETGTRKRMENLPDLPADRQNPGE
jgi:hypothetical protein